MSKLANRRARALEIINSRGSLSSDESASELTKKELRSGFLYSPRKTFKAVGDLYQVFVGGLGRWRRGGNNLNGQIHHQ
jgi:hypothetical protein